MEGRKEEGEGREREEGEVRVRDEVVREEVVREELIIMIRERGERIMEVREQEEDMGMASIHSTASQAVFS